MSRPPDRRRSPPGQAAPAGVRGGPATYGLVARGRTRQTTGDQEGRRRAHPLLPTGFQVAFTKPTKSGMGLRAVRNAGLRADPFGSGTGGAQDPARFRSPWSLKPSPPAGSFRPAAAPSLRIEHGRTPAPRSR